MTLRRSCSTSLRRPAPPNSASTCPSRSPSNRTSRRNGAGISTRATSRDFTATFSGPTHLSRRFDLCEHLLAVADADGLGLNRADPTTLVVALTCAFASIEQQHDPSLRGRPLAIAAYATNAATIVSSSREARDLGIKTGMRVFEARAILPKIVVMEPNPPRYRAVSDRLMEILERHSPDVLRMSIDEASVDLAGTPDLVRLGPEGVGRAVKHPVREEGGECVTCSIGVSTSIWMAKQASNLNKRDGLERIDHANLVAVFG